jgi:hypothetical protein
VGPPLRQARGLAGRPEVSLPRRPAHDGEGLLAGADCAKSAKAGSQPAAARRAQPLAALMGGC